jgi:hypothetical protein
VRSLLWLWTRVRPTALGDLVRRTVALARVDIHFAVSLVWEIVGLGVSASSVVHGAGRLLATGLLTVLTGLILLGWTWQRGMAPGGSLHQEPTNPADLPKAYEWPYADWETVESYGASCITSPDLNRALFEERPIGLTRASGTWHPVGTREREYARLWPTRPYCFNESKLRLASDLTADVDEVELQRTRYAAYIVTNHLAQREIWKGNRRELGVLDVAVRPDSGLIRRLADSACSNHLGGDILVVSTGTAFLQTQGQTEVNPGRRVASASGSFDYADLRGEADLVGVVKRGLLRELVEEMGLSQRRHQVPQRDDVRVIAYARATYAAGKPQFFAVARLGHSVEVRRQWRERRWLAGFGGVVEFDPHDGADGLVAALRAEQAGNGHKFAESLHMLIEFIERWLAADRTAPSWLFDESRR